MTEALAALRQEIERLDAEIVRLIAERVRLARAVGEAKRGAGMPTLDHAREAAVVRRAVGMGRDAGLPDDEVRSVFWHVIGLSRRAQMAERGA